MAHEALTEKEEADNQRRKELVLRICQKGMLCSSCFLRVVEAIFYQDQLTDEAMDQLMEGLAVSNGEAIRSWYRQTAARVEGLARLARPFCRPPEFN